MGANQSFMTSKKKEVLKEGVEMRGNSKGKTGSIRKGRREGRENTRIKEWGCVVCRCRRKMEKVFCNIKPKKNLKLRKQKKNSLREWVGGLKTWTNRNRSGKKGATQTGSLFKKAWPLQHRKKAGKGAFTPLLRKVQTTTIGGGNCVGLDHKKKVGSTVRGIESSKKKTRSTKFDVQKRKRCDRRVGGEKDWGEKGNGGNVNKFSMRRTIFWGEKQKTLKNEKEGAMPIAPKTFSDLAVNVQK